MSDVHVLISDHTSDMPEITIPPDTSESVTLELIAYDDSFYISEPDYVTIHIQNTDTAFAADSFTGGLDSWTYYGDSLAYDIVHDTTMGNSSPSAHITGTGSVLHGMQKNIDLTSWDGTTPVILAYDSYYNSNATALLSYNKDSGSDSRMQVPLSQITVQETGDSQRPQLQTLAVSLDDMTASVTRPLASSDVQWNHIQVDITDMLSGPGIINLKIHLDDSYPVWYDNVIVAPVR